MTVYLGPAGNLQALPHPQISGALDLGAAEHRALSGARTVDYVGTPRRTYTFSRGQLSADDWSILEGLALGAYGDGPLVLLDPWRRNMLAENQATAGDALHDLTGWYSYGAGSTVTVQGPSVVTGGRGNYRVRCVSPAAGNAGLALANGASAATIVATGFPVVAGLTYTFSVLLRTVAGTPQLWRPVLRLFSLDGSTNTGNIVGTGTASTGSFVLRTATGAAAASSVWAVPTIDVSALAATDTIEVDDAMITQGSSTVWAMGTGIPLVAFTDMGETYRPGTNRDGQFTLVEVG